MSSLKTPRNSNRLSYKALGKQSFMLKSKKDSFISSMKELTILKDFQNKKDIQKHLHKCVYVWCACTLLHVF